MTRIWMIEEKRDDGDWRASQYSFGRTREEAKWFLKQVKVVNPNGKFRIRAYVRENDSGYGL